MRIEITASKENYNTLIDLLLNSSFCAISIYTCPSDCSSCKECYQKQFQLDEKINAETIIVSGDTTSIKKTKFILKRLVEDDFADYADFVEKIQYLVQ